MSEKKFTPGPWVIGDENNQHAQVCLGDSNCSVDMRRFADYPNCPGMSRDEMLANAALIAAAPDLYDALDAASLWMWDPDENSVESFERINEWFMKETGHMRPGKSYPMETPPPDNLQQIWDEWRTKKSRDVLLAIRAALAKARGEA